MQRPLTRLGLLAAGEQPRFLAIETRALLRISTEDVQHYPTILMPYGIDVPVIHASAAIRRILALAYLLIWTRQEHLQAAALRRQEPAREFVLITDEIEAHLHPAWRKRILPSILTVMEKMTASAQAPSIQVIASTHSPLVCVSLEDFFDPEKDRLLDLDLDPENGVRLESVPFTKRGTGDLFRTGGESSRRRRLSRARNYGARRRASR